MDNMVKKLVRRAILVAQKFVGPAARPPEFSKAERRAAPLETQRKMFACNQANTASRVSRLLTGWHNRLCR